MRVNQEGICKENIHDTEVYQVID